MYWNGATSRPSHPMATPCSTHSLAPFDPVISSLVCISRHRMNWDSKFTNDFFLRSHGPVRCWKVNVLGPLEQADKIITCRWSGTFSFSLIAVVFHVPYSDIWNPSRLRYDTIQGYLDQFVGPSTTIYFIMTFFSESTWRTHPFFLFSCVDHFRWHVRL